MRIASFDSFKNYLSFAAAKEFRYADELEQKLPPSLVEKVTNGLLMPIQVPTDYILKNFNQPDLIAALGVIGVVNTTLIFYPDMCFEALEMACSPLFHLEAWMPKYACYIFGETVITSLMIRTFARCWDGGHLLAAWDAKKIVPIHLGAQRINPN